MISVKHSCTNMNNNICSTQDIESFVRDIEHDYQHTQGLILSEHDAQCLLYSKISAHLASADYSRLETADQGVWASPLHTEINFLDDNNELLIRPDITLLDVRNVSMTQRNAATRLVKRKGFAFWGSAIVIELKFCKYLKGITQRFTDSVRRDCEKIERLSSRLYPQNEDPTLSGLVVVFSRSNRNCDSFNQLINEYSDNPVVRILYATSNLNQPGRLTSRSSGRRPRG
jgi:hypothetical protein